MDEDARTIWCGNLSSRCTEEILYELFLQAGPLEKVHIPKDRDGNQKSFGFVTYRHRVSVPYALELFEGTTIYNRLLTIKARQQSAEQMPLPYKKSVNDMHPNVTTNSHNQNMNDILQFGNQVLMGYQMPNYGINMMPMYIPPGLIPYQSQNQSSVNSFHGKEDGHSNRSHPYAREHNNRDRRRDERNDRSSRSDRNDRNDVRNDRNRGHEHHKNSRKHARTGRSRR